MARDVEELLSFIDPADCGYDEWVTVGMALFNEGVSFEMWDEWSRRDRGVTADGRPRYDGTRKLREKWDSFRRHIGSGYGMGTLVYLAKRGGYRAGPADGKRAGRAGPPGKETFSAGGGLSPSDQLKKYLETLFDDGEYVAYVTDTAGYDPGKGRWGPRTRRYDRTCGEIVRALEAHPGDLGAAVGTWPEDGGAWIQINPSDGRGAGNDNVAAFRYCLVESDSGTKKEQEEVYRRLRLPVACLVDSGGKSVHAVVRVDASNPEEYRERVDFVYEKVEASGVRVDRANRNPSRMSRMPGVTRRGNLQRLMATDIGCKSFEEWRRLFETERSAPALTQPANAPSAPLRPPAMIEGILEFGHKMMIAGPSKAGKSFFAIELGLCISAGREFLGFATAKTKVLYVNLEISEEAFGERVYRVAERLGCLRNDNFYALSLRGAAKPADGLVTDLVGNFSGMGFGCVIIDPVYKIMPGDENSAEAATRLTNELDALSAALNCAVIYVHHHSKGAQGGKAAIDRASGSGILARDADEIFNLTEVEVPKELLETGGIDAAATVWELDMESRDFGRTLAQNIYFEYPVHRVDGRHLFDGCRTRGSAARDAKKTVCAGKRSAAEARAEARDGDIADALDALGTDGAAVSDIARVLSGDPSAAGYGKIFDAKRRSVYRALTSSEDFVLEGGLVRRKSGVAATKTEDA